ncbi:endonuclease domain-containing protein [Enterobacter roggenkampii]|uniref:endonuclease domain-containing protein n=1 Tax=Enterobacter roggenkampii TaxID=1812935 RepID=UPI0020054318|nr:endonuclease domain-containing protein [Enterobacter roggenkampii]MCK6930080.1 endonuclease domain-containing protein [Enterobacter roggenkampii]
MLRIPDSDWRTVDGGPQISVAFLRKVTPQAARFTQWVQRTHARLLKAPEDVLSCCTSGLIDGEIPDKNGWLSAGDALAMLTYSVHPSQNVPLIDAIEQKSGLTLPVRPGESRLEGQFAVKLRDLIVELKEQPHFVHYELIQQKQIDRYRVDFFLTEQWYTDMAKGKTAKRQFIIEFDEEAHRTTRYQLNDKRRDRWLRKNLPDVKLIRVRHEEMEVWLEAVRQLKRFVSIEDCYAHCLRMACISLSKSTLKISSKSAQKAYDAAHNECRFLLKSPKQPLSEMGKLLDRLEIPFDICRDRCFQRAKLRSYGI